MTYIKGSNDTVTRAMLNGNEFTIVRSSTEGGLPLGYKPGEFESIPVIEHEYDEKTKTTSTRVITPEGSCQSATNNQTDTSSLPFNPVYPSEPIFTNQKAKKVAQGKTRKTDSHLESLYGISEQLKTLMQWVGSQSQVKTPTPSEPEKPPEKLVKVAIKLPYGSFSFDAHAVTLSGSCLFIVCPLEGSYANPDEGVKCTLDLEVDGEQGIVQAEGTGFNHALRLRDGPIRLIMLTVLSID